MPSPDAELSGDAFPPSIAEPLVPILRLDQGGADREELETWHQALSNALTADVRHDLLALWLYPSAGGVVLLQVAAFVHTARLRKKGAAQTAGTGRGERSNRPRTARRAPT